MRGWRAGMKNGGERTWMDVLELCWGSQTKRTLCFSSICINFPLFHRCFFFYSYPHFRLGCSILKEGRCVSASWTTTIIWDLAVFKPNQRKCLKFNQRFMHDVRGGLQAKFISSFYSHCLSHNCPYTGEYRLPHGVVAHLCSLITSFFFFLLKQQRLPGFSFSLLQLYFLLHSILNINAQIPCKISF